MNAKIEVSPAVAKALQETGKSADEVLREALGAAVAPEAWTGQGVTLPNGTQLRAWHAGRAWWAEIRDGKIVFKEEEFDSPSGAALRIAGRPMNGWEFWEAHIPGVRGWVLLGGLRPKRSERSVPDGGRGGKGARVPVDKPLRNDRKNAAVDSRAH